MKINEYHEQYSRTLFFRNTSNRDFKARVSGSQPGTLMSKFLRAASWAKTFSKLLTSSSYLDFKSLINLFFSSMFLYSYLIWCLRVLVLLSWIDFSSSISLCFVFYLLSICSRISRFSSFYLASHLAKLSFAWFFNWFSVFWRYWIFSSPALISCSRMEIFSFSWLMRVSFCLPSSSKPAILLSNCLILCS